MLIQIENRGPPKISLVILKNKKIKLFEYITCKYVNQVEGEGKIYGYTGMIL